MRLSEESKSRREEPNDSFSLADVENPNINRDQRKLQRIEYLRSTTSITIRSDRSEILTTYRVARSEFLFSHAILLVDAPLV